MSMLMNRHIRRKLRVKGVSVIPYSGWKVTNRGDIAELFHDFDYKIGAEIGVKRGEYSDVILKANPGIKFFCIDPWTPYGGVDQRRQDRNFKLTQRFLAPHPNVTFIRKTSMDALDDIPDRSLDFVYIDALHNFDYVMMDIIGWSKKVRSLGMVSGHDFTNLHECGVIPAVEAYTRGHAIFQWFVTQDQYPSFFWINP
jgi:hypothetical protein